MTENKSDKTKKELISEYMAEIGRKGGNANKKKGSDFFSWVRSHRDDNRGGDSRDGGG